jgi:hypothetical protein
MTMTPVEAVHTFARRYCLERIAELKQGRDSAKSASTDKDITYSSRRAVVEAVLVEVERLTPADFRSRGHAALRLIETSQIAQNHRTEQKMWQTPPYLPAMQEERDRFADALRLFAAQADWKRWRVEPLPYRRTLPSEERKRLMAKLKEQWSLTGKWWIPFEKYDLPYETVVVDSQAVSQELGYTKLKQIFACSGVERVFELWEIENEPDREIALDLWEPSSAWAQRYWCSDALDWLVYTTHENSMTIAGVWLLNEIKAEWPDWEAYRWIAPWAKQEPSK